ncbi:hypothetical protein JB92DRAFT_2998226 [Gautieria morchelliformis]|nr:hypothetical protein JB92DRAFT_2998226 [Gautieria morchelliformis]
MHRLGARLILLSPQLADLLLRREFPPSYSMSPVGRTHPSAEQANQRRGTEHGRGFAIITGWGGLERVGRKGRG